jgi:branched-chain amino acid transport system permease protein
MWLQFFINSFSLGSLYALIALGFSLIFGVTHAFNLAHGELILISGYLAYSLGTYFDAPFLGILPLCMIALPVAVALLHQFMRFIGEPFELNTLVVTFGLSLVLQNCMLMLCSADYRMMPAASVTFTSPILDVSYTSAQILLIVLSLAATWSVHLFLRKTFLGKALRATIQNREAARLSGINVHRMGLIAFGIGGLLIGLAGPLFAQNAYLHPSGGTEATLIAIVITIFAGIGRTRGILLGGWILGFVESLTVFTMGGSWRELVSALVLIVLLLVRPKGVLAGRVKQ